MSYIPTSPKLENNSSPIAVRRLSGVKTDENIEDSLPRSFSYNSSSSSTAFSTPVNLISNNSCSSTYSPAENNQSISPSTSRLNSTPSTPERLQCRPLIRKEIIGKRLTFDEPHNKTMPLLSLPLVKDRTTVSLQKRLSERNSVLIQQFQQSLKSSSEYDTLPHCDCSSSSSPQKRLSERNSALAQQFQQSLKFSSETEIPSASSSFIPSPQKRLSERNSAGLTQFQQSLKFSTDNEISAATCSSSSSPQKRLSERNSSGLTQFQQSQNFTSGNNTPTSSRSPSLTPQKRLSEYNSAGLTQFQHSLKFTSDDVEISDSHL